MDSRGYGLTRVLVAVWWLYLVALIALCVLVRIGTDVWWPATLVGFGPRWALLTPTAAAPLILLVRRRLWWTIPPALAAGAVLLNVSVGGLIHSRDEPRGQLLRVVTQNVGGGRFSIADFLEWLAGENPDLVALQECSYQRFLTLEASRDWHVLRDDGVCLASRFPIRRVMAVDRRTLGGTGDIAVRYEIDVQGRLVTLLNVHLETPRAGFEATLAGGAAGLDDLALVGTIRTAESALARMLLDDVSSDFIIVAGDFNMPEESAIYRRFWSGYVNVFSEAGVGLGHTKSTEWFGVRIDHLLTGKGLKPVKCWLGRWVGGDHRALVADLEFVS